MDTDSWLLLVLLISLILGGGYFAAAETAFASVNPVRITHRAEDGDRRALRAQSILKNFNAALSTLLIGNNIMHIGTAALSTFLVTKLWGEGFTAYCTLATTLVVFLVSEMVPKQYAKDHPEAMALAFAGSLYWLMKLLSPIAKLFDGISAWLCKVFQIREEPTITEDELVEMIDSLAETEEDGQQRTELLQSALKFDDAIVYDVMTPLQDVVGIEWKMSPETITDIIKQTNLSRLPVYKGSKENMVGVLHIRNYIKHRLTQPTAKVVSLSKLMKKVMIVDDTKRIDVLFDEMTQSRTHMCAVKNSNGTIIGIVTMEDILEQLVGEIWDEYDVVPPEQEASV